jgi:hypothetical protein
MIGAVPNLAQLGSHITLVVFMPLTIISRTLGGALGKIRNRCAVIQIDTVQASHPSHVGGVDDGHAEYGW